MTKVLRIGVAVIGLFFLGGVVTANAQTTASLEPNASYESMLRLPVNKGSTWCKTSSEIDRAHASPGDYAVLRLQGRCGNFAQISVVQIPLSAYLKATDQHGGASPAFVFESANRDALPNKTPVFIWLNPSTD
jgi:hypothetical protein